MPLGAAQLLSDLGNRMLAIKPSNDLHDKVIFLHQATVNHSLDASCEDVLLLSKAMLSQ